MNPPAGQPSSDNDTPRGLRVQPFAAAQGRHEKSPQRVSHPNLAVFGYAAGYIDCIGRLEWEL
jgi:hypothetical protein